MSEKAETNPVGAVVTDERLRSTPEKEIFTDGNTDINYVANGQIMVQITLAEYRALVCRNAEDRVNEARSKRWDAEKERDELKKQVADLQKQLDGLKSMIASAATVHGQMQEKPEGNG
ncbi:MAG: hypothetical protein IKG87_13620 [Clostridia bacterium]|nr:hypothetical protein [Clostridia bacterium]